MVKMCFLLWYRLQWRYFYFGDERWWFWIKSEARKSVLLAFPLIRDRFEQLVVWSRFCLCSLQNIYHCKHLFWSTLYFILYLFFVYSPLEVENFLFAINYWFFWFYVDMRFDVEVRRQFPPDWFRCLCLDSSLCWGGLLRSHWPAWKQKKVE